MEETEFDLEKEYKKIKNTVNDEELTILKEKMKNKNISKKEYKKYIKLSNIKENMDLLDNIMEYINDMKQKIICLQKEKEERKKYREIQKEEGFLKRDIGKIEKEITGFKEIFSSDEVDDEEREYIKEQLENDIKDIETKREKLKEVIEQKNKMERTEKKYQYSYEEQKEIILEIIGKIKQFSIVAEQLVRGKTWEEAIDYFLEWQRDRLQLDKKDRDLIAKDIKQIKDYTKIGNEIVKVAYNYDEIKEKQGEDR